MKVRTFLLALVLLSSPALADIVMVNEAITKASFGPGGTNESYTVITTKIKGNRHRTDIQVKGVVGSPLDQSTIVDSANGTIVRLKHSKKVYDRVTPEELEKEISASRDVFTRQGTLPITRPVLKPTGKTKTIRSFAVDEYTCARTQGDITWNMTYWLARALAKFVPAIVQAVDPVGAVASLQFPDPASFAGVPVEIVIDQRLRGGQVLSTINLLSIEEKPISDSEFLIPKDYTEEAKLGVSVKR